MFNKFFSFFDGKIKSDPNDPDYLNNIKKCPGLAGLLIEHWEEIKDKLSITIIDKISDIKEKMKKNYLNYKKNWLFMKILRYNSNFVLSY